MADKNGIPFRTQPSYALVYAGLLPKLQDVAKQYGYALAVHGSMATDLDLVAAPWTEDACDAETLVNALAEIVGAEPNYAGLKNPGAKPHGRLVWTLLFNVLEYGGWGVTGPYIDLSVMPRTSFQSLPSEDA
ncbi:MAG: hypothetical protein JSS66_07705 [Armatimonadetes bacterium]|nr:hypothetical protein [Armatimonadota bacterium]